MLKKLVPLLIVGAILLAGYRYRSEIKAYFSEDSRSINSVQKTLLIRGELNYKRLGEIFEEEGLVDDKKDVYEFMEDNGLTEKELSPGKYLILPHTQMSTMVNGFIIGEEGHGASELKVNVVFNRCRDVYEMGRNIAICIQADSAEIVNYVTSKEFLDSQGIKKEELNALFIPDTYEMYFDTDAKSFADNMLKIRSEFWKEERRAKLNEIKLTQNELATLASIVYSEQSQRSEEWPIIAGLYLNRLKLGMKLQSDPTFKYCWGDKLEGVEQLTYEHRSIDCPYNTYNVIGLPPGPICLVPAEVLDAVLNAEIHDYIYMMAKPGGKGHNFSETLRQHDKFVAEYRKWFKEYKKNKGNN